MDAPK
jgi:hypothetical protein